MKKLMFAAAAVTAGFAMAATTGDAIVSANIVGYAQGGLREGATIKMPQFLGVDVEDGKIELQTLKCRSEDNEQVSISRLDSMGGITETYLWVNWGGESGEEECWVSTTTFEKPDPAVYFTAGEGLWVEGASTDNALQSSGEVGTADIVVTLQEGATMTGNFTPVQVELQDILCRSEDNEQVSISRLDSMGGITETYLWVNWGGESGEEECWVSTTTFEKPDPAVYFTAGEGLWVEGASTDNKITFPGVEL